MEHNNTETPRSTRSSTATSTFGVSRREGHDASGFYNRFSAPKLSSDDQVRVHAGPQISCLVGNGGDLSMLDDATVALVVTSPPYFAGKQYEAELDREGIPSTYLEYLDLLRGVFAECVRVLEPGGRIAVNVANLGRKPFRSLAADVTAILQDDLGLLLRGEIIWQKAKGAGGNCAWGSFKQPSNPVLRDVTERVIIASKGRFDRALSERARAKAGLPHVASTTADEFMAATLDLWSIDAESATRIGHPAPFPVELPRRLIELYTYEGDLVLDPFLGSGTTLVAAKGAGRRGIGVDLDPSYVALAQHRVDETTALPLASESVTFKTHVTQVLIELGLQPTPAPKRKGAVVAADLLVKSEDGDVEVFIVGGWTVARSGLESTTTALELIGRATLLAQAGAKQILCITPQLPSPQSESARVFRASEELLPVVIGTKTALHAHFFPPSKESFST